MSVFDYIRVQTNKTPSYQHSLGKGCQSLALGRSAVGMHMYIWMDTQPYASSSDDKWVAATTTWMVEPSRPSLIIASSSSLMSLMSSAKQQTHNYVTR